MSKKGRVQNYFSVKNCTKIDTSPEVFWLSRHALYGNGILSGGGPQFARASQETKLLCIALRKILPWSSFENMADDKPSLAEVSSFDSSKLKHVKTVEKNTLPSSESKKRYFFIARHIFCTTEEFLCSSLLRKQTILC